MIFIVILFFALVIFLLVRAAAKRKPPVEATNLIHCPACSREVSTQANSCPHCGQPIRAARNKEDFAIKIAIAFFLVSLLIYLVVGALREAMSNL